MPRKPNKPTRRRYSDEERANALAALSANADDVNHTANQLGIPRKTLENWAKGARHPEAAQLGQEKKPELADALEEVARKLADAMPAKIADASLRDTAIAMGIAVDKMRLLREAPTSITQTNGTAPDGRRDLTDRLERLASALEDAADRAGAGAAATDGT
jgi:transposase-like protein